MTMKIKLDGTEYDVRVVYDTLLRSFAIREGANAGTALSGRRIFDLIGTDYAFSMQVEPNPANPTDYDSFFDAISAPVETHTVELPYGQSTISFECYIQAGGDAYHGILGAKRWRGLSVTFTPVEPQRTV